MRVDARVRVRVARRRGGHASGYRPAARSYAWARARRRRTRAGKRARAHPARSSSGCTCGTPSASSTRPACRDCSAPACHDPGPADERTNWWWQRWWIAILDPDEGRHVGIPSELSDVGDAALRRHLDDARTWAEVAHEAYNEARPPAAHDLTLGHVVAEREAALGRPVRPFRLRIEVLPLTTAGIWWIGENAIAVDELLRADLASYALALEPIIERLA